VTHNLALVRTIADTVVVLQHGRSVEAGSAEKVLDTPAHKYTSTLVGDTPSVLHWG
jgi:peptide/nickel transport system ATP-binding protein